MYLHCQLKIVFGLRLLLYNMKIFESMLKHYQICGINIPQSNGRFNKRIVVCLLFIFWFFVSLTVTFLFKSTTMNEYMDALSVLVLVVASVVNTFECIWTQTKAAEQIKRMENTIEKSRKIK